MSDIREEYKRALEFIVDVVYDRKNTRKDGSPYFDAIDTLEEIQAVLCAELGHSPIPDQCGIPAHDYCEFCNILTPRGSDFKRYKPIGHEAIAEFVGKDGNLARRMFLSDEAYAQERAANQYTETKIITTHLVEAPQDKNEYVDMPKPSWMCKILWLLAVLAILITGYLVWL